MSTVMVTKEQIQAIRDLYAASVSAGMNLPNQELEDLLDEAMKQIPDEVK